MFVQNESNTIQMCLILAWLDNCIIANLTESITSEMCYRETCHTDCVLGICVARLDKCEYIPDGNMRLDLRSKYDGGATTCSYIQ